MFLFTPARCGVEDGEGCVEREGWLGGLEMVTLSTAWETCHICFWQGRVFKRRGTCCATYSSSQMAHWGKKSKPFSACLFKLSKYLTEWMSSNILKTILHGKTIRWSLGSPTTLHFPEIENPPRCSPGRHVAGWAMPADHRHRRYELVFSSTSMLLFRCTDLSPFSPVVWIPPEGLNKFFL